MVPTSRVHSTPRTTEPGVGAARHRRNNGTSGERCFGGTNPQAGRRQSICPAAPPRLPPSLPKAPTLHELSTRCGKPLAKQCKQLTDKRQVPQPTGDRTTPPANPPAPSPPDQITSTHPIPTIDEPRPKRPITTTLATKQTQARPDPTASPAGSVQAQHLPSTLRWHGRKGRRLQRITRPPLR